MLARRGDGVLVVLASRASPVALASGVAYWYLVASDAKRQRADGLYGHAAAHAINATLLKGAPERE